MPVLAQKLTPACALFRQAPGAAPTYDSCGRAGGGPHPTGGKGEYVNTSFAKFGQLGSTLPKQPSGAVWRAGEVVETLWNVRANQCAPPAACTNLRNLIWSGRCACSGGGYQYRLCVSGLLFSSDVTPAVSLTTKPAHRSRSAPS